MLSILLDGANAPFTIALGVMLGLGFLEIAALLVGFSAFPDSDADVDLDANADGVLAWLGIGETPLLVTLVLFLTAFGLVGLGVRLAVPVNAWTAAVPAALAGLAAAKLKDAHGQTHDVLVECQGPKFFVVGAGPDALDHLDVPPLPLGERGRGEGPVRVSDQAGIEGPPPLTPGGERGALCSQTEPRAPALRRRPPALSRSPAKAGATRPCRRSRPKTPKAWPGGRGRRSAASPRSDERRRGGGSSERRVERPGHFLPPPEPRFRASRSPLVMWTSRILMGGALLSAAAAAQPLRPVVVVGPSMSPTYASGEALWTTPVDRPLRRGDVVVAQGPDGPVIKRVALLAGDRRLQWRDRNDWMDMTVFNLPRHPNARLRSRLRDAAVPPGTVFLLGDNLDRSVDSREFGPVPLDRVLRLVVDPRSPDARSGVADRAARHWIASAIRARSL